MADEVRGYKLTYNKRGCVIPPQSMDTPIGFFTAYLGFALPFALSLPIPSIHVFPILLQYTPSFYVLKGAGLLSGDQIGRIELFILVYIFVRFATFPIFSNKYLVLSLDGASMPIELRKNWPRQFFGALKFGAVAIFLALTVGLLAKLTSLLSPKYVFGILELLGGGLMFFTEGLIGASLYYAMYHKDWRASQ